MASKIYGIDLGTSYSSIAYVDEYGKSVILASSEGEQVTASVVYFESSQNIVVGSAAKEAALEYPDRVVSEVKRHIGSNWQYHLAGECYKAQDISAYVLGKLMRDAKHELGEDELTTPDVVVTCPAYFGVEQKQATKQAGEIAGMNVLHIIPEPTAAAISYGVNQHEQQTLLVFDLGGGTFDASLIQVDGNDITVVCTDGESYLGGMDWDEAVVNWVAEQVSNKLGKAVDELLADGEFKYELRKAAESAKIRLSSAKSAHIRVNPLGYSREIVQLDRETLHRLTDPLLQRTLAAVDRLLATGQQKGVNQVDKVLLVGGSSYMPQIQDAVKDKFSHCEVALFDPRQAVAKGAALYGHRLRLGEEINVHVAEQLGISVAELDADGVGAEQLLQAQQAVALQQGMELEGVQNLTQKTIHNVTPKGFGVVVIEEQTGDEVVQNLVAANETIPLKRSHSFGTWEDNQTGVVVLCMENTERAGPDSLPLPMETSTFIGRAELSFTRPLPRGSVVTLTFKLSDDGLLSVAAKDETTRAEIRVDFRTETLLTNEEMLRSKNRHRAQNEAID